MLGDPRYHGPAEAQDLQEYTEALQNISAMVAAANALVNGSVQIGAILIDSEKYVHIMTICMYYRT